MVESAAVDRDDRGVSIRRIFSRAFGTIGGNPSVTLGIGFLFGGLPSILLALGMQKYGGQATGLLGIGRPTLTFATMAVNLALATITQGALVRATVAYGEGRAAGFSESAGAGLAVALPLLAMAVLSGLGIGLGLLFLVVPGIWLYVIWSVAAPALVEERLGPVQALGRSRDLTRGARWKVFAVTLISIMAAGTAEAGIGLIDTSLFGGPEDLMTPFGPEPRIPFVFYSVNALFQTFYLAVLGVIETSLYVELREWQEGPQTGMLADIFG